ncbi:MAG: site-2 protease family protein [Treponema sp.]|nr:site-2 protease family protein [Treponema sp.]
MKWVLGLLALIVLIIFHEFGHFFAAKIFGVKVESFSVGMGPVLFHKTIKGTDWRLSLFPIGGYCGMKGENDFREAIENNLSYISCDKDSLYGIHPLKRALIGFAGPFHNFFFAFLCYTVISITGYTYYSYSNKIILAPELYENTSLVASQAGLLTGDEIIAINGKKVDDFSDIIQKVSIHPQEKITLTVIRNGKELDFSMIPELDKESGTGKIGIAADTSEILEKEAERYSFFPAIGHGFIQSCESVGLTIKSIGILFKGVNLDNAVSGPARVTDLLGSSIQEGFSAGLRQGIVSMLELMAIISISLFIMNLLPLPVLDGGLILIAIIEFLSRKKVSPKVLYYSQFVGLAFIAVLFIIGLKGDIMFFLNKGK